MSLSVFAAIVIASVCVSKPGVTEECHDLSAVYLAEKPFVPNAFGTDEMHKSIKQEMCSGLKQAAWTSIDGSLNTPEVKAQGVSFEIREMKCVFATEAFFNNYLTEKFKIGEDNDAQNN